MLRAASCTPQLIAAELVAPAHSGSSNGIFWPSLDINLGIDTDHRVQTQSRAAQQPPDVRAQHRHGLWPFLLELHAAVAFAQQHKQRAPQQVGCILLLKPVALNLLSG